jgi:hypothetical protein
LRGKVHSARPGRYGLQLLTPRRFVSRQKEHVSEIDEAVAVKVRKNDDKEENEDG